MQISLAGIFVALWTVCDLSGNITGSVIQGYTGGWNRRPVNHDFKGR